MKGVQDYEIIELVSGTRLRVEDKKGNILDENYIYSGKPKRMKAFVQNNYWKFIPDNGNTYTVMNGRAR